MSSSRDDFQSYVSSRSAGFLRLGWLLTGDLDDAEDLVQTALARAFQHWTRVLPSDDIDAYGRRIIMNTNRSHFRRHRPSEVPLELGDNQAIPNGTETTVHDRSALGPALRSLPTRQRQIVVLRYIEELSEQETATILGCSVGTVKSAASRGLAAVRRLAEEIDVSVGTGFDRGVAREDRSPSTAPKGVRGGRDCRVRNHCHCLCVGAPPSRRTPRRHRGRRRTDPVRPEHRRARGSRPRPDVRTSRLRYRARRT